LPGLVLGHVQYPSTWLGVWSTEICIQYASDGILLKTLLGMLMIIG